VVVEASGYLSFRLPYKIQIVTATKMAMPPVATPAPIPTAAPVLNDVDSRHGLAPASGLETAGAMEVSSTRLCSKRACGDGALKV
jgi:hypothetical protein